MIYNIDFKNKSAKEYHCVWGCAQRHFTFKLHASLKCHCVNKGTLIYLVNTGELLDLESGDWKRFKLLINS